MISWYIDSSSMKPSRITPSRITPSRRTRPEEMLCLPDPVCQLVNLVVCVVHVERGPRAGLSVQRTMQRRGTVMSGPHGNSQLIEHLTDVVRMDAIHYERH